LGPDIDNYELMPDSPCVDSGSFLTTTSSPGSGNQVHVADARYFSDGLGLINGDEIRIGNNEIARVTAIHYEENRITLDREIRWTAGDGVSYPYRGDFPDMGAYEYEELWYRLTLPGDYFQPGDLFRLSRECGNPESSSIDLYEFTDMDH